ncbi:MAG: (2Fe-2S)-binding protein, partial [Sulfurifustaceae bacterium]
EAGWRYELAGDEPPARWPAQARRWLGGDGEWLEFEDIKGGRYRAARIDNGRLTACLFVAPTYELPARSWPTALLARDTVKPEERLSLLSGREPTGSASDGPMVCVCFGVGRDRLVAAIRHDGLTTTQAIGLKLGAGTNCGSCLPELKTLIASNARQPA